MSITRRRFVFLAILCLILGAATTMGVAVACARWANLQVVGWGNFQRPGESWALDVQSSFGFDAYGLTSRAKAAPSPGLSVFSRMCVVTSCGSPFTRQQAERRVEVDGDAAKPASELVDHDSGGNAGGIDGAA